MRSLKHYTHLLKTCLLISSLLAIAPITGVLGGLPLVTGAYNFTIKADAGNGCGATRAYVLMIQCPIIAFTPAALPDGPSGVAYSRTLSASPAGGNYAFVISAGMLPNGLALNAASGALSGTPAVGGMFNFTVTATGFGGFSASQSYTLKVVGGGCMAMTLPDLPDGHVGRLYSQAVPASPAGNYNYAVTNGALPPGLTLYGAAGLIYGYPTDGGTFTFTLTATGTNGCAVSRNYVLAIAAP